MTSKREDAPFGRDENGEILYWPDESRLSVVVPVPMEQLLEHFGEALGVSAQEAAIFLLRNALIDSRRGSGDHWLPDRSRYLPGAAKAAE